jgi:hypothetical protein
LGLTVAILRYQSIMPEVNAAHKELLGCQTICQRIEKEVKGKFERLLVKMVENSL